MLSVKLLSRWAPLVIVGFLFSACGAITGTSEVSDLETRQAQLQGTIEAMGTPAATNSGPATDRRTQHWHSGRSHRGSGDDYCDAEWRSVGSAGTVYPGRNGNPGGCSSGRRGQVQATPDPAMTGSTNLLPVTLAMERDPVDCPLDATSTFDIYEDRIDAMATFTDLHANSVITARWTANGTVVEDQECWTVEQDWPSVCGYCDFAPPNGMFRLAHGAWT